MDSLTKNDFISAQTYAAQMNQLKTRNLMLKISPHIGTHTTLKIRAADPMNDYIFEPAFTNRAIVVDWKFNKEGCNTSSCFPTYPGLGVCAADTEPFSFELAQKQLKNACQPACFNSSLAAAGSANKPGDINDKTVPYISWDESSNKCFLDDIAVTSFFIDPAKRLSSEYDHMDSKGFQVYITKLDADGNPLSVGKIDKNYCHEFEYDFIHDNSNQFSDSRPGDMKCDFETGAYIVSIFLGTSLVRMARMAADKLESIMRAGAQSTSNQILIKHPPTSSYLSSIEQWKSFIDISKKIIPEDITLSDLNITRSNIHMIWTDEFSHLNDGRNDQYGGRLIEPPSLIPRNVFSPPATSTADNNTTVHREKRSTIDSFLKKEDLKQKLLDIMTQIYQIILRLILDPIIIGEVVAGEAVQRAIKYIKSALKTMGPEIIRLIVKSEILKSGQAIAIKLLGTVVSSTIIQLAFKQTVMIVGKVAMALAGIAIGVLDVVGWIMLIGPILDLFFALVWDPLKLTVSPFSDALLRKFSECVLTQRQIQIGQRTIEMTPYNFWKLHIAKAIQKYTDMERLNMFLDLFIYFHNRTITEEGTQINWDSDGELVVDDNINSDEITKTLNQFTIWQMIISPDDIYEYEQDLNKRCVLINQLKKILFIGSILSIVCMVLLNKAFGILSILLTICFTGKYVYEGLIGPDIDSIEVLVDTLDYW
jgi:hypothetical protein